MPFPLFACSILASTWFPVRGIGPNVSLNEVGQGPISTRNGRVLCLPFMRFVPRADFLDKGQTSLEAAVQVINDVRRDPKDVGLPAVLFEDQETQRLSILYSKGFGHSIEGSVELPLLARNGGFMDPLINWWHHELLPGRDRVRDHIPEGQSIVTIPGVGTFSGAIGVGDVSFFARKRIAPRLIAAVGAKLPTGNASELFGSGSFDVGANLEYRTMINRKLQFDASVGVVGQGKPTVLKRARGLVDQEFFALTYRRNSRDAWIAQWQSESSPVMTVPSADGAHRMLTFGYERKLNAKTRLDLYFCEDSDLMPGFPALVNIAPDFTIGIRVTKRF
jgi:hypothetical protein